MAECLAIRSVVMTAASSNIRSLTVYSDSQVFINMLKRKESQPSLFGIMGDIYHFSRAFEAISFVFIPRWENLDADLVAKASLVREETLSSAEA